MRNQNVGELSTQEWFARMVEDHGDLAESMTEWKTRMTGDGEVSGTVSWVVSGKPEPPEDGQ